MYAAGMYDLLSRPGLFYEFIFLSFALISISNASLEMFRFVLLNTR